MLYFVYELINPETREPFYVGYAKRRQRPFDHIKEAKAYDPKSKKKVNRHKIHTILKILSEGNDIIYKIVFESNLKEAAIAKEIELIAHYGRADKGLGKLTNHTDGGDGAGTRIKSAAELEKARVRLKGKTYEEIYGPEKAEQIKEAIRKKAKGRKCGPAWNAGLTKDTDSRMKQISESLQGQIPWNKGIKTGVPGTFLGKTHTKESRKKISEACKGRIPWNKGGPGANTGKKRVHKSDGSFTYEFRS